MKADPFAQLKLLDLQTRRLRTSTSSTHQLRTMPELAALATLAERRTDVAAAQGQAQTDGRGPRPRAAQGRRRRRAGEGPARAQPAAHRRRPGRRPQAADRRCSTSSRRSSKRISDLEDEELEVMERLEEAQAALGHAHRGARTRSRRKAPTLVQTRDEKTRRDRRRSRRRCRPSATTLAARPPGRPAGAVRQAARPARRCRRRRAAARPLRRLPAQRRRGRPGPDGRLRRATR